MKTFISTLCVLIILICAGCAYPDTVPVVFQTNNRGASERPIAYMPHAEYTSHRYRLKANDQMTPPASQYRSIPSRPWDGHYVGTDNIDLRYRYGNMRASKKTNPHTHKPHRREPQEAYKDTKEIVQDVWTGYRKYQNRDLESPYLYEQITDDINYWGKYRIQELMRNSRGLNNNVIPNVPPGYSHFNN